MMAGMQGLSRGLMADVKSSVSTAEDLAAEDLRCRGGLLRHSRVGPAADIGVACGWSCWLGWPEAKEAPGV